MHLLCNVNVSDGQIDPVKQTMDFPFLLLCIYSYIPLDTSFHKQSGKAELALFLGVSKLFLGGAVQYNITRFIHQKLNTPPPHPGRTWSG